MNAMAPLCPRGPSCRRANARLLEVWKSQRRGIYRPTPFLAQKASPETPAGDPGTSTAIPKAPPKERSIPPEPAPRQPVAFDVYRAEQWVSKILESPLAPTEEDVLRAINACTLDPIRSSDSASPTSAILSLDSSEPASAQSRASAAQSAQSTQSTKTQLANLAYRAVTHPPVFITPTILHTYITTLAVLQRPQTFPTVLHLYANKPVLKPDTKPPQYKSASPRAVASAVPEHTAAAALDAALERKDLLLALDIIDQTYRAPAFVRAKVFRKASLPAMVCGLTPPVAWMAASKISELQTAYEPHEMQQLAFMAIMAYVVATGTVGFVAVSTANDHMERVTWADGMPLRQRWLREEERAALDKVALAWGFKEVWRRGEEEGQEWEGLREWVGLRGMVLDRVTLMEGMQ